MPRAIVAAIALFATACTPMQWVRPGADAAQLEADSRQCQTHAWQEARWRQSYMHPFFGPVMYTDAFGRRYLAYPRSPFMDPYGDRFMEEQRLASFCMHAKGYKLEEVPKN